MGKYRKTPAIELTADTPEYETTIIEAVDIDTPATEPEILVEDSLVEITAVDFPVETESVKTTSELDELWAQLDASIESLGRIGHLYYAEKGRQEIKNLVSRIRQLI